MKKIAKYNSSKKRGGSQSSSGGIIVAGGSASTDYASNAAHADKADLATKATEANHAASAATLDENSDVRLEIADIKEDMSNLDGEYLSKTHDDTAAGIITFLKGILFGEDGAASIDGDGNTSLLSLLINKVWGITKEGIGKLKSLFVSDDVNVGGTMTSDKAVIRELTVTGTAHFFSLDVDHIRHTSGGHVETAAEGFEVEIVEDLSRSSALAKSAAKLLKTVVNGAAKLLKIKLREESEVVANAHRLYWRAEQDGRKVQNMWEVGDQALSYQTHISEDGGEFGQRIWWTVVTGKGSVERDGITYNYIDVDMTQRAADSATCDIVSNVSVPKTGDPVVQLGHRGDDMPKRQNAIYEASTISIDKDCPAPVKIIYVGINDYNITTHRTSYYSLGGDTPKLRVIADELLIKDGSETTPVPIYHSEEWTEGTITKYYHLWPYQGQLWLCIGKNGNVDSDGNVIAPQEGDYWKLYVKKSDKEERWWLVIPSTVFTYSTAGGRTRINPGVLTVNVAHHKTDGTIEMLSTLDGTGLSLTLNGHASSTSALPVQYAADVPFHWSDKDAILSKDGTEIDRVELVFNEAVQGDKGDDAVELILTPSTLVIGTDDNGTAALTGAETITPTVKQGDTTYTIENIELSCDGCNASWNSTTGVITITEIYNDDEPYVGLNGDSHNISITDGYIDVTATYNGGKTITGRATWHVQIAGVWHTIASTRDSLKSTIASTEETLSGKIEENATAIEQTNKSITREVSERTTADEALEQKYSQVKQTADEINLSVQSLANQNLLLNSGFGVVEDSIPTYWYAGNTASSGGVTISDDNITLKPINSSALVSLYQEREMIVHSGTNMVLSVYVEDSGSSSEKLYVNFIGYNSSGSQVITKSEQFEVTSTSTRVYITFTVSTALSKWRVVFARKGKFTIHSPKLELGTQPTAYTANDNDGVLATGIDILNRAIRMVADNFTLYDNSGNLMFGVQKEGSSSRVMLRNIMLNGLILRQITTLSTWAQLTSVFSPDYEAVAGSDGGTLVFNLEFSTCLSTFVLGMSGTTSCLYGKIDGVDTVAGLHKFCLYLPCFDYNATDTDTEEAEARQYIGNKIIIYNESSSTIYAYGRQDMERLSTETYTEDNAHTPITSSSAKVLKASGTTQDSVYSSDNENLGYVAGSDGTISISKVKRYTSSEFWAVPNNCMAILECKVDIIGDANYYSSNPAAHIGESVFWEVRIGKISSKNIIS